MCLAGRDAPLPEPRRSPFWITASDPRHRCRRALVNPFAIYWRREERVKPEPGFLRGGTRKSAASLGPLAAALGQVDDVLAGGRMPCRMTGPLVALAPGPDARVEP